MPTPSNPFVVLDSAEILEKLKPRFPDGAGNDLPTHNPMPGAPSGPLESEPPAGAGVADLANWAEEETSAGKSEVHALPIEEIASALYARTGGWPRVIGDSLFAPAPTSTVSQDGGGAVNYLTTHHTLFAWARAARGISDVRWRGGEDSAQNVPVTQKEFHEHLRMTGQRYDAVEGYPHLPPVDGVYYLPTPAVPKSGRGALNALVEFYLPASERDEAVLRALIRTLIWGGPGGTRPMFLIYSGARQGGGKTRLVETLSSLVGGCAKVSPGNKREPLAGQLLAQAARRLRVALLDNVTGAQRSPEIADLLTSRRIYGDSKYERISSRPNVVTWAMTTNEPSLSTDLADRAIVLHLDMPGPPDPGEKDWDARITDFIEAHRWEILADVAAELRSPGGGITVKSRWEAWASRCLSKGPLAHLADQVLDDRLVGIADANADASEVDELGSLLWQIEQGIIYTDGLPRRCPGQGEIRTGRTFTSPEIAAAWEGATGEKISSVRLGMKLSSAIDSGRCKWLSRAQRTRSGKGYTIDRDALDDAFGVPPAFGE